MSFQLFLADKFLRFSMKRRMAKNPDVMSLREMMNQMPPAKVPPHVQIAQMTLGGVPTERLATATADPARAVLYIHGGGFVGGSPATHRALTWRLADQTASTIYAIDYRLAPEYPFPAGLDDCISAYRALLETHSPANLSVGGDSAGGNLTLALCLKLKLLGLPQPSSAFCLSPVTELAGELESRRSNSRKDAMFDAGGFGTVPPRYCPNHDAADPLISVLRADVAGLPPTLLHCSRDEMLRDDSVRMAERLRAAAVDVELEVWPKVFHVWHIAADTIPESRNAIEKVVRFINGRLGREKLLAA